MSAMESFHFLRPFWLLLIPVAVVIWWLLRKSNDPMRGWRSVMDADLLNALTTGREYASGLREHLLLSGWICGAIALAGPTWRPEPSPFADDPRPVMVVLKSGETMNLSDLSPNRMERAQLKISDFAGNRKGQPLGLIAYAGSAHLVLPPTRDSQIVADMASEISPAIMPKPGDDLARALTLATETMKETGGALLVITDTVPAASIPTLKSFREEFQNPVFFLAVARESTPELEAIEAAAQALNASVELMSPDTADIETLVNKCANTPILITSAEEGMRWEEAGWWLLPIPMLLSLLGFRREQDEAEGDQK